MNKIDQIISEKTAAAEEQRKEAEQARQEWEKLNQVQQAAEQVQRFWPSKSTDPEYDPWNDKLPSRQYWLNKTQSIIDLCKAAKKAGFDGDFSFQDNDAEVYVAEIYRLAWNGKKKKPAELLLKMTGFDEAFRVQCDQLARITFPRQIISAIEGEKPVWKPPNWGPPRNGSEDVRNRQFYEWYHNPESGFHRQPAKIREHWNVNCRPEKTREINSDDVSKGIKSVAAYLEKRKKS